VLDNVQRRPFLVEPARKDPLPALVELRDIELHKGAGIMFLLPGRGLLAGAQADDHIADPRRLAGLERDIAGDAVALVEQAEHRDALRHRGCTLRRIDAGRQINRDDIGRGRLLIERGMRGWLGAGRFALLAAGAGREQRRDRRATHQSPDHASGTQAS